MRTKSRARNEFRPGLEGVESRALTAAVGAGLRAAVLARAARVPAPAAPSEDSGIVALNRRAPVSRPRLGGGLPIGPGLGQGLVRVTMPMNYVDYGVVTLWNNTTSQVTFGVSASTYANGQYFSFTLNPGQYRSFFATYTATGQAPTFKVAINPNFGPVTLPQVNTVFEAPTWVPSGTEGRPYAINVGVNGLYLSYV